MCKKHNEIALVHKNEELILCILHIALSKTVDCLTETDALRYIY